MASNPKMEYQAFLCIFHKNSALATLGLNEMGKFLWEGREKSLPSKTKLRQPTGQTWYSILGLDAMPLSLKNLLLTHLHKGKVEVNFQN